MSDVMTSQALVKQNHVNCQSQSALMTEKVKAATGEKSLKTMQVFRNMSIFPHSSFVS